MSEMSPFKNSAPLRNDLLSFFELYAQHITCQADHNTAVHRCAPCNMVGHN